MSNVIDFEKKRSEKRVKDCQEKYAALSPMEKLIIGPILLSQGVIFEKGKENE